MKKRLLSLVLCLVMVFSLLPVGSLAIERPAEQYVSAGTNWKTTTNYQSAAEQGNNDTLYYKDGDNYYPVSWQTGQQLYTISGTTSTDWTPRAVANGTYYYNVNSDKLTFSQVSTKSGDLYYPSTVEFKDITDDDMNLHTSWWYWDTYYFVKADDITAPGHFSRLNLMNYGYTYVVWGGFKARAFYWRDGSRNSATPSLSHHTTNIYDGDKCTQVSINGSFDLYDYQFWADNVHFGLQTYLRTYGANSIWYNNGGTQLGSTVYETDADNTNSNQKAWTGALYVKNSTGTTTLTNKDTGAAIPGVSPSAINGDTIYTGDLYVLKKAPLPQPEPTSIITTEETGDDGVYTSKELTANGDAYDVTLTAYTTGNEVVTSSQTITPTVKPMDIVMVIDQSGSMATRDMGNTYTAASTPSGGWTVNAATGGKQYYYSPDGGANYYPVYASTGYIYEKVDGSPRASDLLGSGDDAISLGVNGAPTYYNITTDYYVMGNDGELHRLYLITAGLFLQYGLYPYIYVDNNDAFATKARWEGNNYWVAVFDPWDGSDLRDNKTWNMLAGGNGNGTSARFSFVNTNGEAIGGSDDNANSARLSYSWFTSSDRISNLYQLSSTKVANQLYYVDAAGNKQPIGKTAQWDGEVVYTGTLYEGTGTSRVDALKAAVTEFANTVQTNAKQFGVDHRMALVGFAGNKVPAYSLGADATTVGSNGLKDYTNTGLFYNGGFENYEKITGYERTTDQYINRHYYRNISGLDGTPVRYSDGWYTLNLLTGARTSTTAGNWYQATYEGNGTSLSAADYRAALVSVNNNDALNSNISTAISQFAANGGTYTSYGMTMAEQLYKAVEDAGDTQGVDSEGQTVERQRVIIVFTDGEPGANGYDSSIAGEALVSGNLAKTEQDAIVYTVGLFKSAPSSQVADFMKKLSSEYEMTLAPVYGGEDNDNNSLGSLNPNKTYYYKNETTGKYYAVTTEYGTGSSLGWWIYNGSHSGSTESYSLTNPRRSTGAGTTVFYNANGSSVNGEDVVTGRTYYTSGGDKIVYEYRWFDSDRSVKNPALQSGQSTSAGEARVQFYDLAGAVANDDGLSYYMTASNAAELNNVFAQIAGSIVSEEVTVENGSAYTEDTMYVMDEISADFDLPANLSDEAENNHVTVYADTVSEWNADGSPKTYNISTTPLREGNKDAIEAGAADVEVVWNGKKLQINYFDFGRMYMQDSNPNAARIRVVIDGITPNRAGDANVMSDLNPYVDNESGNALGALKSNTAQSGLYYKDPESGAVTLVEGFKVPSAPVPGYTVKWVNDQGTNMANPYDQDTDLIKGNVPVYDGGEPTKDSVIEENVSRTDYTFDGWSTTPGGDKVISITRDAESGVVTSYGAFPAVVNSDVTYYAHFSSEVKTFYTATWFNGADQLFEQKGLASGDVPAYAGEMPTKDADADYTYFFAGWHADSRYDLDDTLPYQQKYTAEYLQQQGVITQLPEITDHDVTFYAVFAPVRIGTEVYVMEYGTKNIIRESGVYGFDAMYTPGGEFGQDKAEGAAAGNFYFVPMLSGNSQYATDKNVYDMTGFSKVNTGVFYEGENNTAPTKVNVIPGSSVYFDDSLKSVSASVKDPDAATKTYNYEAALEGVNAGEDDTESIAKNTTLTFKFTGTRIDVYCTTEEGSKSVKASILDEEGNLVGNLTGIVNNHADHTRYNVPTVSFVMPEYGTYTLQLRNINATYKLDGVRVYNPLEDDSVYEESEQNAIFLNLRSKLVTGLKAELDAYAKAMEDYEAGTITEEPVAPEAVAFYNEKGSASTADYITNSPKNEIYLAPGEKVAFAIKGFSTYTTPPTVMIGLSNQDGSEGKATVNGEEKQLKAVTDSYYTVNMANTGKTGYVVIENTGDKNNISLTNLRISGVSTADIERANSTTAAASVMSVNETSRKAVVEPKLIVTKKLTSFVENPEYVEAEPDPTPDPTEQPTHQPTMQELIRQLLSEFVRNLFGSIGRLFGN